MGLFGNGSGSDEGVEQVAQRLENLESHLNAVDSAVQDIGNRLDSMSGNFVTRQELAEFLDESEDQVSLEELKEFFMQLSRNQKQTEERIDDMEDLDSELVDTLKNMQKTLKKAHQNTKNLESRVQSLEKKASGLERRIDEHDEQLEETKELKKEVEAVEEASDEDKSFNERQKDVEDELKDLRGSIKQFSQRVSNEEGGEKTEEA